MLHVSSGAGNAAPSIECPEPSPAAAGFKTTGLPDEVPGDFHDFMCDVLGDEPELSAAELDALYADYVARQEREAARARGGLPTIPPLNLPIRTLTPGPWPTTA